MAITTKPNYGDILTSDGRASGEFQTFLDDVEMGLNDNLLGAQVTLTSYTVATVPAITSFPGLIFVSDESGGAVPAFSVPGEVEWRRITDRAVIT